VKLCRHRERLFSVLSTGHTIKDKICIVFRGMRMRFVVPADKSVSPSPRELSQPFSAQTDPIRGLQKTYHQYTLRLLVLEPHGPPQSSLRSTLMLVLLWLELSFVPSPSLSLSYPYPSTWTPLGMPVTILSS